MKVQCLNQHLKNAVHIAERNTSKNQTLPILSSVLLEVKNNQIVVRATNLETAIELSVPSKTIETGVVVVSAKVLSSFLSNVPDEQVVLQSQKNNLSIKTNKAQTLIRGYLQDDFPIFPKVESTMFFKLSSVELRDGLSSVIVAASQSDIKPELASVLFKIFKNTIKIAATDSFRLAEKTLLQKNVNAEKLISFLMPQKSAQEAIRLMESDEVLDIGVGKNQLFIRGEKFNFISRLTEGTFPDYEQIIPKQFKTTALLKRSDAISGLKLASVFVGKLSDLAVNFNTGKKNVVFGASSSEVGESSVEVEGTLQGEDVTAKFNWRYFLDGVAQIKQEYVVFSINSSESPLLMTGRGDNSYLYLVMPMRGV